MKLSALAASPLTFDGDVLALGRRQGEPAGEIERVVDAALGGALAAAAERLRFKGKARQVVTVESAGRLPCSRVVLLGLGESPSAAELRDFAALAANEALTQRYTSVGVVAPTGGSAALSELATGLMLGAYRFTELKTPDPEAPTPTLESATLLTSEDADAALARGYALASAVNAARTLVNEPPNICTPERLADFAKAVADGCEAMSLKTLDEAGIREAGMGGLVAVSQGASRPPRFIHLTYSPKGAPTEGGPLVLVGKGLTFDSGGLSLKPPKAQEEMYIDMGGAAAVLGAMQALAALDAAGAGPRITVHALVAACENMPDGNSFRPSDILTMYSGKTVEVLNTDAEGRLVLADALHYGAQLGPRAMVNLATLTGACMVALGHHYAALLTDDDAVAAELLAASEAADERLWRLPLDPKLAKSIESKRADIANIGGPYGGAITAGWFLHHFKGDAPWAHLDIAGPTLAEKDDGHIRRGGTGYGVLTLVALAERLAASPAPSAAP